MFMGIAVLIEAGLSFVGAGIQPPAPSWGGMLADSQRYLAKAWWYGVFPGLAIFFTVLGLNLIGDGISDRCGAGLADVVFARAHLARDLAETGVAFEPFEDFVEVREWLEASLTRAA